MNVGGGMKVLYAKVGTELWSGLHGKMWKFIAGTHVDWVVMDDVKKPAAMKKTRRSPGRSSIWLVMQNLSVALALTALTA